MQSLAIKYRPKKWKEVVEQDSVKIILQNQLDTGEIKNSLLFVGGAGTGKTTSARIYANELNKGMGNPIELDAASNNGVDDVRNIIKQAQSKSLDSEYKVFIIDECFPANTLVSTKKGQKFISDICVGDIVKSMSGYNKVTHIFKNSVLTSRLCCVTIDNIKIVTTVEHLFFTNNGWIKAQDLQKGDIVYDTENLQELWQRVCQETGQRREILLSQLFGSVSNENTYIENESYSMSSMWKVCDSSELFKTENLFGRLQEKTNFIVEYTNCEYRIWDGFTETIIRAYEEEQSNEAEREYTNNVGNKREKWNTSSMEVTTGWKREIYNSTDTLVRSIREWLGVGISNKHEKFELARTSTTLVLQSRPWLSNNEDSNRGRWQRTSLEKWIIERQKENRCTKTFRVESVEIYKRGYNDELFRDSFTDTELSQPTVTMYDLEVENDHSYFVNNVLVHNCHALSNSAWQAMLKLIEEPPAKSVFIFCTTNPEKIPKTILSRVQRYDFKMISQDGIIDRLQYILECENRDALEWNWEDDAIEYIAKLADGHLRDSLTMLDKCLAYSTDLTLENVVKALGTTDYEIMFELLDDMLKQDIKSCFDVIEEVHSEGKDLKQFVHTFIAFLLDISKYGIGCEWKYISIPQIDTYIKYIQNMSGQQYDLVNDWLKSFIRLNADIKYSATPKIDIECMLMEVLNEDI